MQLLQKNVSKLFRSPTLQTVLMVEETIKKYSGELNKRKLSDKLPRKVMWDTLQVIINYLEDTYKILIEDDGKFVYIWNPKLAKKFRDREDLTWQK